MNLHALLGTSEAASASTGIGGMLIFIIFGIVDFNVLMTSMGTGFGLILSAYSIYNNHQTKIKTALEIQKMQIEVEQEKLQLEKDRLEVEQLKEKFANKK
jgi:hypothetical protein